MIIMRHQRSIISLTLHDYPKFILRSRGMVGKRAISFWVALEFNVVPLPTLRRQNIVTKRFYHHSYLFQEARRLNCQSN